MEAHFYILHFSSPKQKKLLEKYQYSPQSKKKEIKKDGIPDDWDSKSASLKLFPVEIFMNEKEPYKLPDISMLLKFQYR